MHSLPFFSRFSAYVGTVHHSFFVAVIDGNGGGGSGGGGFLSSPGSHYIAHVRLELTVSHADFHLTRQRASFLQPLFAFFSTQLFLQGPEYSLSDQSPRLLLPFSVPPHVFGLPVLS